MAGTTMQIINRFLLLTAGALICVESLLLLVGMNILRISSWSTPANLIIGGLDVAAGIFLAGIVLFRQLQQGRISPFLVITVLVLLTVTHVYRDIRYLQGVENPFCANVPLFIFNNIRLGFVILAAIFYGLNV